MSCGDSYHVAVKQRLGTRDTLRRNVAFDCIEHAPRGAHITPRLSRFGSAMC